MSKRVTGYRRQFIGFAAAGLSGTALVLLVRRGHHGTTGIERQQAN